MSRGYWCCILLVFTISFCGRSIAQEKLSRSYTVKDGLASNTIYKAIVDKRGFMWFATDYGVSMFDGATFTNFSAEDGLADNDVIGLFEDNEGRIWFLCFQQQPCFYYKGKIYNASNFPELQKMKNYSWVIVFIDDSDVWFSGKESIYRFSNNKIMEYKLPSATPLRLITRIDSSVYILAGSTFLYFDKAKNKLEPYPGLDINFFPDEATIDIGNKQYILIRYVDQNHVKLYRLKIDIKNHTSERTFCYSYDKRIIYRVYDKKNHLLRLTFADNSIVEKDVLSDTLRTVREYKPKSYVSDIVIDNQGNRWLTFLNGGIEMFPGTYSNKVTIPGEAEKHSAFCSIAKINGDIVVGNNYNTLFFINNGSLKGTGSSNGYIGNNRVVDIKADKHNKLWMGMDNDVCIYDPVTKKFHPMSINTNIKDIKYDSINDVMLMATSKKAIYVSCKNPSKVVEINNERTTSIAGSISDTCWFATFNGLYIYDGRSPRRETSFSAQFGSRVTVLERGRDKRLWVGTSSNGVFVVQDNKVIFHFTPSKGLVSNICKNIFLEGNNDAWVSTNLGVSHIRTGKDSFTITNYNDKNCLVDNNVSDVLVSGDTVYVTSSTGIAYFSKNNVTNSYKFPVYVTRVKVGDKEIPADEGNLILNSRQNTLSISFAGLSYLSNGDISYQYYISELHDDPLFTKNNTVTFSKLSPGTYNFYVSGIDVFGNKSMQPAHLQFTIVPEWYQLTWLRWLAGIAVVTFSVFFTFKYSKRQEKEKRLLSEVKQTISRLELEAIHSQINPHFIFNCLNAIQSAVYKNNTEAASYFINRFAKLMRQALMLSKEGFISIEEEYNFISNYLDVERLRHNDSFDYTIEVDNTLNRTIPSVPAFVLQPFIENAINHGIKYLKNEKGHIIVKFIKAARFEIHLEDNGIGINAAKKINENISGNHHSKGLEITIARVKSLNEIYRKNIEVKITDKQLLNKDWHGTEVIISLDLL